MNCSPGCLPRLAVHASHKDTMTPRVIAKMGFIIALCLWGFLAARHPYVMTFLHGPDLVIHEFGHLLFAIFGNEPLTVLGGSLTQLLVPVGCGIYFFLRKWYYSAAVMIFWVGQNFFDIALYVHDACILQLPLVSLGGDEVIHDWNYLLDLWGILIHSQEIARTLTFFGMVCYLAALGLGVYYADAHETPIGTID